MKKHLLALGAFAMLGLGFGMSNAFASDDDGGCANRFVRCQISCTAQGYTGTNNICFQFCSQQFAACGGYR